MKYIGAEGEKKVSHPHKLSCDVLAKASKDQLIKAKMQFFLAKIDVMNKEVHAHHSKVDAGFAAEAILTVLSQQEKISPRQLLEFRMECLKGLTAMNKKILDKSPLKYSLVLNISCLDPRKMSKKLEICVSQMKKLTHNLNAKTLAGGLVAV
ncbi:hypothetical protein HHUSO_G33630 [Huso huso]|uniref:Uncharacterized protein n=1 Tax=Huso huso TaxID=61971 RepID=A0ABR0Y7I2_HUSHU